MFRKLAVLVLLNFAVIVAFVLTYLKHQSLVPLYVGFLPLLLCNVVFVREFIRPATKVENSPPTAKSAKRMSALSLFIMPVGFFFALPALIRFDSSLGWSPIVCFGFSILLCIVMIAFYGGLKTTLRKSNS